LAVFIRIWADGVDEVLIGLVLPLANHPIAALADAPLPGLVPAGLIAGSFDFGRNPAGGVGVWLSSLWLGTTRLDL
jgi:hypothetical protein